MFKKRYFLFMSYAERQTLLFKEACNLLSQGEDPSSLLMLLDPEHMMRLRVFTRDLPTTTRELTIFGRANKPAESKRKK